MTEKDRLVQAKDMELVQLRHHQEAELTRAEETIRREQQHIQEMVSLRT